MVSATGKRSSKRPREYHDVELNERVRKRFKKLEEENRELREAMDDLKGLVECPVCLTVPRQGSPMPVCSNGHFVCLACRDQIRQAAGLEEAKCPSCMVVLGNATSVLASRVIQRVTHDCEHDGCEEKIPFAHLEKHRLACLFRKVLCPGCRIEKTVHEVAQHIQFCEGATKCDLEADKTIRRGFTFKAGDVEVEGSQEWNAPNIGYVNMENRGFLVQEKREGKFFFSEMIMIGSEEDCRRFLITMKIRDKDGKEFSTKCHPRSISMERWGNVGLWVHIDALSSLSKMDGKEDEVEFDIEISFEKLHEDEKKDQDENEDKDGDESQDENKSESEDEDEDESQDEDEFQDEYKSESEDEDEGEDDIESQDEDKSESEDEDRDELKDDNKGEDEDKNENEYEDKD